MRRTVGRVLTNPLVRAAIITAVTDIVQLYAKAFVNVVKRKLEDFVDEKDREPQKVEVTLED